jgi:hypothetical protein
MNISTWLLSWIDLQDDDDHDGYEFNPPLTVHNYLDTTDDILQKVFLVPVGIN